MNSTVLIIVGGLILTIGDIAMKQWVVASTKWYYILGLTLYLIGAMFLAESFKDTNIAVASIIFILTNVISLVLVSWLWYDEPLTTTQLIGIALGIIAAILLEI